MDLLAIETASSVCGIALFIRGELVDIIESELAREHAEKLPLFYDQLRKNHGLRLSSLDGIAVSIGPGSFTGLRIGLSYSKGLALSGDIPLVPVPTLAAMAVGVGKKEGKLRCILHSHRDVVYYQDLVMADGFPTETDAPRSVRWEEAVAAFPPDGTICHHGCDHLLNEKTRSIMHAELSARYIGEISLAAFDSLKEEDFNQLEPNYISPFKAKVVSSAG